MAVDSGFCMGKVKVATVKTQDQSFDRLEIEAPTRAGQGSGRCFIFRIFRPVL